MSEPKVGDAVRAKKDIVFHPYVTQGSPFGKSGTVIIKAGTIGVITEHDETQVAEVNFEITGETGGITLQCLIFLSDVQKVEAE
mgnify:FL=1